MINLMAKRYWFFAASIAVILAGFIGLFINGLELDIQFQGGTVLQIQMNDENFETSDIEAKLGSILNKTILAQKLQTYNPDSEADKINLLMLKVSKDNALTDEEINNVVAFIRDTYNITDNAQMQVESVEPVIGQEMMRKAFTAFLLASALIVVYVWWRFSVMSGLSAALMALLALVHDAVVMFSVYTIFRIPINEAFVAAILTIIGYSLNDTIIIYDRIRENSRLLGKAQIEELVNRSILQSLSRSINTVITVLFCIITVYVFASVNNIQMLKDFSLPLIVGLASGGYSSIFVASPLWMMWKNSQRKKRIKVKKA